MFGRQGDGTSPRPAPVPRARLPLCIFEQFNVQFGLEIFVFDHFHKLGVIQLAVDVLENPQRTNMCRYVDVIIDVDV